MELLQLLYFCTAAETENFAEAGKLLNVPAASISQSVRRLEKELGVILFNRQANAVELNERGRSFYIKAKSGLDILSDARKKVSEDIIEGTIKLLVISNIEEVNIAIAEFCRVYKNVSFKIDRVAIDHYDKYDLIITDNFAYNESYLRKVIINDDIVLAINRKHPLAKKENLTVKDIQNERLVLFNDGSGMLVFAKRICSGADFAPKGCIQCDDEYSVAKYVEMNLGIAFVAEKSYSKIFSDNVVLKSISDEKRPTVVCYNRHKYMTKAVQLFLDTLVKMTKD